MISYGFTYNNKHSSEFGIYLKTKSIPLLPTKRVSEEVVLKRHGSFKFEDGYDDKIIELECTFVEDNFSLRRQKLRDIAGWLNTDGELIFDSEPDKYYAAKMYNQIPLEIYSTYDIFPIIFVCEPFCYSRYINESITLDSEVALYTDYPLDGLVNTFTVSSNTTINVTNLGTFEADPLIEIEGSADAVIISANDQSFSIQNISQKVYVDCRNMLVYTIDGLGQKQNKLQDHTGSFIKLKSGINAVNIEGDNLNITVFFNFRNTYL